MKRTLVISDIHGCYDEFNLLLDTIKYNPDHDKLILLGDYCDRGPKSKEVIEKAMSLVNDHGVVALRGNHDQMFIHALDDRDDDLFLYNGGLSTIQSYCGLDWFDPNGFDYQRYQEAKQFIRKHYKHHIDFLKSLPVYHEDDKYIYVHAGLNPFYSDKWRTQPTENFLWIRDEFINSPTNLDKVVIFGHTPTSYFDCEGIWFGRDKIGVDCGCVFGYKLGCLEIGEEGYRTYYVPKRRQSHQ